MQLVKKMVMPVMILLALSVNTSAQGVFTDGSAQVLYPTMPDYHTYPAVPMESAPIITFDSPETPVRVPTIPPNAAHGLEHQSAFVIPVPRVITQQKMGIMTPMVTTTVIPDGLTRSATRIMTPGAAIHHIIPGVSPSITQTVTITTPGGSIMPPEPTELPRGVPSRFMTTIPTTSYSDELPVTVTITISP